MSKFFKNMTKSIKENTVEFDQIAGIYRLISYYAGSIAYIMRRDGISLYYKLIVILIIGIVSLLLIRLYKINAGRKDTCRLIVLLEYLGVGLLLLPTGGINSPFVWYILNSMLLGFRYMSLYTSIVMISVYYLQSTYITYLYFNYLDQTYIGLIEGNLYHLFSLLMVGLLIKFLLFYNKQVNALYEEVERQNQALKDSRDMLGNALEEMMVFELIAENVVSEEEFTLMTGQIMELLCKSTNAAYVAYVQEENGVLLESSDDMVKTKWQDTEKYVLLRQSVIYNTKAEAEILMMLERNTSDEKITLCQLRMHFLSKLLVLQQDKIQYLVDSERQEIMFEKNRIADELHDGLSQRLFNISCGIFALKQDYQNNPKNLNDRYNGVVNALSAAIEELRGSIYQLSTKKQGKNSLMDWLNEYTREIERIHDVDIRLKFKGNEDYLSPEHRKTIYRICSESIGNSIRHGDAELIWIGLNVDDEKVRLEIIDNGCGFVVDEVMADVEHLGIGLKNIHSISKVIGGEAFITSNMEMGTEVLVELPI